MNLVGHQLFKLPLLAQLCAIHITCRLVAGDVRGKFGVLFSRVSAIQKKSGAFDVIYLIGLC